MKNIRILIFTLLACFLYDTTVSFACSCQPRHADKSFKKQIKLARREAKAVFSGKVVEITPDPQMLRFVVRFKVENYWKESGEDEILVETGLHPTICGVGFEMNEGYLVYAYNVEGTGLGTSICERTKKLEGAEKEVNILEKFRRKEGDTEK